MKQKEIEQLSAMYSRYYHKCFLCDKTATQRAHIIGNTKVNRRKYGKEIIDSPLNWLPACSLYHNSLIDIGHSTDVIADMIKGNNRPWIEAFVRENVSRKKGKS